MSGVATARPPRGLRRVVRASKEWEGEDSKLRQQGMYDHISSVLIAQKNVSTKEIDYGVKTILPESSKTGETPLTNGTGNIVILPLNGILVDDTYDALHIDRHTLQLLQTAKNPKKALRKIAVNHRRRTTIGCGEDELEDRSTNGSSGSDASNPLAGLREIHGGMLVEKPPATRKTIHVESRKHGRTDSAVPKPTFNRSNTIDIPPLEVPKLVTGTIHEPGCASIERHTLPVRSSDRLLDGFEWKKSQGKDIRQLAEDVPVLLTETESDQLDACLSILNSSWKMEKKWFFTRPDAPVVTRPQ